jgi:hypothetical protein
MKLGVEASRGFRVRLWRPEMTSMIGPKAAIPRV